MCFSKPKTPDVPPAAPIPDAVSATPDADKTGSVKAAREQLKKKVSLSKGRQSTIATGALGLDEDANVKKKTLLGSA